MSRSKSPAFRSRFSSKRVPTYTLNLETDPADVSIAYGVASTDGALSIRNNQITGEQAGHSEMLVSLTKEGFETQYLSIPVSIYAEEPAIVAIQEEALSTLVGHAPNMPEEVRVFYSDNTSGMIGLKWADHRR